MIRATELSKDQVRGLLANCFADMARDIERTTSDRLTGWEREEQLYCSTDRTAIIRAQSAMYAYDREVRSVAQAALAAIELDLDELPLNRRDDVLDGAARLLIERERLRQLRLTDRLTPFEPKDPLFSSRLRDVVPTVPIMETASNAIGPTLGQAITVYLNTKQRVWTIKTHTIRTRYLGYQRQHFGEDRLLASITTAEIREFRDAITTLRRNSGRASKQSFEQKQTANAAHRISDSTIALIFVPTKAFFRWCLTEQGYINRNPAENIRLPAAKPQKGKPPRRPFSDAELKRLFSAPVFTGCHALKRRFTRGARIFCDGYYWIPILGLYTGARLGELVQLHLADVDRENGIPYLNITEEGSGKPAGPDAKHVKSKAGVRKIPLHPDLIALGFLKFVENRRSQKKAPKRLFAEIKIGADTQASSVFSKWFGRLMTKSGLTDPALVFHSLRHNAEDAFRDALRPKYVIDKIIGHTDGSTAGGYGQGVSLQIAYEAVCAMKHKISLIELLEGKGTSDPATLGTYQASPEAGK